MHSGNAMTKWGCQDYAIVCVRMSGVAFIVGVSSLALGASRFDAYWLICALVGASTAIVLAVNWRRHPVLACFVLPLFAIVGGEHVHGPLAFMMRWMPSTGHVVSFSILSTYLLAGAALGSIHARAWCRDSGLTILSLMLVGIIYPSIYPSYWAIAFYIVYLATVSVATSCAARDFWQYHR